MVDDDDMDTLVLHFYAAIDVKDLATAATLLQQMQQVVKDDPTNANLTSLQMAEYILNIAREYRKSV